MFDEIAQYSNSVRIALLEEDSQNIEAIQRSMRIMIGPILMGVRLIADSITPNSAYTIERFTSCENNSEVALFTSLNGGHNLYETMLVILELAGAVGGIKECLILTKSFGIS